MKEYKDGWHTLGGYRVYIEDGYVLRGLSLDGQTTRYMYEANKDGGFDKIERMKVGAFKSRCARNTMYMF